MVWFKPPPLIDESRLTAEERSGRKAQRKHSVSTVKGFLILMLLFFIGLLLSMIISKS